jgi:hypothetical protein
MVQLFTLWALWSLNYNLNNNKQRLFRDMCIRTSQEEAFQAVREAKSTERMAAVLSEHFDPPASEIEAVMPADWSQAAGIDAFRGIEDVETRKLALKIFGLWPLLFRKACFWTASVTSCASLYRV